MKKLLLLFAIIMLGFAAKAQDLQFSQVVLYTFSAPTSPYLSPIYTVPTGKVWKLESAGGGSSFQLRNINGVTVAQQVSANGNFGGTNLPAWFPEGTTLQFYTGGSSGYASLVEFTVTP